MHPLRVNWKACHKDLSSCKLSGITGTLAGEIEKRPRHVQILSTDKVLDSVTFVAPRRFYPKSLQHPLTHQLGFQVTPVPPFPFP